MCQVVEIIMLVGGLYTLVTAKVPSLLVSGGEHRVEGTPARVIGGLLMLPLPAALLAGLVLAFLFGQQGIRYTALVEGALVIASGLLAVILMRVAGRAD
jgi:hypothetical protein